MVEKINFRLFSMLMALILAVSTLIPASFAQASPIDDLKSPSHVLELEVVDSTTNETYSTSILFTPGANWDESLLEGLDERFIVTKSDYRTFLATDDVPALVVSSDSLDVSTGEIKVMYVETIFDIGNFTISLAEFIASPNLWTGFNVVMDGAAVVFPGVPSVNGVKRMIGASDTLKTSLKTGVKKYGVLQKDTIPTGWQRHHIFEQRFASVLGTTSYSMLAIAIPYSTHHKYITDKMAKKIPTGQDYTKLSKDYIINQHIAAYEELYRETYDPVWEFLWEFSKHRQHTARN